jgi:hypothetical protein
MRAYCILTESQGIANEISSTNEFADKNANTNRAPFESSYRKPKKVANESPRNIMMGTEYLAFSPAVLIGTPLPHPLARRRVCPLPLWFRGGGVHALLAGEWWGSPNSDEGTDTVVLY